MAIALSILSRQMRKTRIVHRLPGRLRLHIPALEKLPSRWHYCGDPVIALIKLKDGIQEVQWSAVSGRMLVGYDVERLTQAQVVGWLKKLALWLCAGYLEDPFVSKGQVGPFLTRMTDRVGGLLAKDHRRNEVN